MLYSIEGNRQHLDGGAMFGNAPKEIWQKWIVPDARNRIPLACRSFLLQTEQGRNILFEAGIGNFFPQKLKERYGIEETDHLLLKNLDKIGIKESDIDVVVLSHLHFDHAGGLLSADGETPHLLFPKAQYVVGRDHWRRAKQPHIRERASFIPTLQTLLEGSGRCRLIEDSFTDIAGEDISFYYSHGHTIGLMLSEIQVNDNYYIFVSDLIPGMPWIHLPLTMGYDRFPELLVNEKELLYRDCLAREGKTHFLFTHDPVVPCATLTQDAEGKYIGVIPTSAFLRIVQ